MRRLSSSAFAVLLVLVVCAFALTLAAQAQAPAAPAGAQAGQAPPQGAPPGAQPGRGGAQGRAMPAPVPGGRGGPAPAPKYHILVVGDTKGYHHGSTSDGLAMFWNLGKETGAWDTEIKTDFSWITKKNPGSEAHSLPFFHAVVFVNTTGDWGLSDEQKADLLSYVHEDGRGIVLAHAAIDANYKWPEFAEMAGGWFNAHPWGTFDAPVIVEDPTFPAMQHLPRRLQFFDEMYSAKAWSRDKVNVLMRMDESKLNYVNPQYGLKSVREDKDEAIAWAKMYGKGRVFYTSLGHTKEAWDDPMVRKIYLEGVKWVMGRTEGSVTPHPKVNP